MEAYKGLVTKLSDSVNKLPESNVSLTDIKPIFDALQDLRAHDVARKPSAASGQGGPTQAELDAFARWFEGEGGAAKGLRLRAGLAEGTGIVATADHAEGDVLVEVPRALMMTEETAAASQSASILKGAAALFPEVAVALHLLGEKHNIKSKWAPYIKILPKEYTTPLYMPWDVICELRGSSALDECIKCIKNTASQFCHVFKELHDTPDPDRFMSILLLTYTEYMWAISVVMTRKNRVTRTRATEGPSSDMVALIPMWDCFNHTPTGKITTFMEGDRCVCRSLKAWSSGQQVLIHYGDRPNVQLFSHNGFVVDNNDSDVFLLHAAPQDPSVSRPQERAQLIQKFIPTGYGSFFVSKEGQPSPSLIRVLRVLSMDDAELDGAEAKGAQAVEEVSERTEAESMRRFYELCEARLKEFATTVQQDDEALRAKSRPLSVVARMAIALRRSEKLILQRALAGRSGESAAAAGEGKKKRRKKKKPAKAAAGSADKAPEACSDADEEAEDAKQ
eukprot:m51a1_g64 putative histone-lysine n-methyltransferase setd3 (507) ;mRNA; f:213303-215263